MKNKILNIINAILFLQYCSAPSYIPKSEELDVNPYGSFIIVYQKTNPTIKGELLAIDDEKLVVLVDRTSEEKNSYAVELPLKNIDSFTLTYAQPVNYSWSIFTHTLLCLTHGFYSLISFPINLIVTVSLSAGGALSYKYSEKEMTFEKLKMFARFPQGFPPAIKLEDIKR